MCAAPSFGERHTHEPPRGIHRYCRRTVESPLNNEKVDAPPRLGSAPNMGRCSRSAKLILAAGIAAVTIALFVFFPLGTWAQRLVEWIRDAGALGVSIFALAYVAAAALLLPGSLLTLGAGFAYGPFWGFLLVSPVSVLAATVAFLIARFLARDWIARRTASDPRFAAVDAAVAHDGFKIVVLLRLSPIFPFNLMNYALGLTRVRLRDYVLASWIGMLPGTALYVYLGSLVTSASALLSGSARDAGTWGTVLYWLGLLATVAVTVVVTRIARRALANALGTVPPSASSASSVSSASSAFKDTRP